MKPKKSVVLVVVIGIMMVVFTLAFVALTLMTQESRIAESKIKRMRAMYAVQAGMINATELLRTGALALPAGAPVTTVHQGIGGGILGYPSGGYNADITVEDYNATIEAYPLNITIHNY